MVEQSANDFRYELWNAFTDPVCALTLRRVFLLMLRFHYNDPSNYSEFLKPRLLGTRWSPDAAKSTLAIYLEDMFNPRSPNEGASICVGIDDFNFEKKVVGNTAAQSYDNSEEDEVLIVRTTVTVSHLDRNPDLVLALAESTTPFLFGFRKALMQSLNLLGMDIVKQTKPKMVMEGPDRYFKVDTVVSLSFTYGITTDIESHRIKKFQMEVEPRHA